jgi:dihydrofolate reductase/thymidylate synthase
MPLYIISAVENNRGIGKNNELPWKIKEDLEFFKQMTVNSTVIMGKNTYDSLPIKPLPNRYNIVITNNIQETENKNLLFTTIINAKEYIKNNTLYKDIFIIGGEQIYTYFVKHVNKIYLTVIDKKYECDRKFPFISNNYKITKVGDKKFDETEKVNYRFIEYTHTRRPCQNENVYLHLAYDILNKGNQRDDRTGTGTVSLFGQQMRFDISESVPILTTKQVGFKLTVEELLFFLRGDTNSKILEDKGINIWKGNTSREFLDKRKLTNYEVGDIGFMYGAQWRHWGSKYIDCNTDYTGEGIDQLENVINLLKTDPFSRRIMMTDYNPSDADKGVLLPCHGIVVQFYVEEIENIKYLSCHMYQRSADLFLGVGINILSYSILTYIIALKVDMKPKDLIISFGDIHIYNTHLEAITEQLKREPLTPPILKLNPEIKHKKWEDITIDDFELIGYSYNHRSSIKAVMAV